MTEEEISTGQYPVWVRGEERWTVEEASKGGQLPPDAISLVNEDEAAELQKLLEESGGDWAKARKKFYGVSEDREPAPIPDWLVKK